MNSRHCSPKESRQHLSKAITSNPLRRNVFQKVFHELVVSLYFRVTDFNRQIGFRKQDQFQCQRHHTYRYVGQPTPDQHIEETQ